MPLGPETARARAAALAERTRFGVPIRARAVPVFIPRHDESPLRSILGRVAIAAGLIIFVTLVAFVDRSGYEDQVNNDGVSLLDAFYYATVSVTTTGYGDIVPVTDSARAINAFFVTPARVLFLILLVSTTLEVLTDRTRERLRKQRWRARMNEHFVIAGFGTKGKSAVRVLLGRGVPREKIVVIDQTRRAVEEANAAGLVAILGNAASTSVLDEAGIERAQAVVVAPERDDAAVLITLTARQLCSKGTTIVAASREEENALLLRQSGADSVITSSEAAGRLLGLATEAPRLVRVLEDLLATGVGLDIAERHVTEAEIGARADLDPHHLVVAVVREHEVLRFDDPRTAKLEPGDRIIYMYGNDPV